MFRARSLQGFLMCLATIAWAFDAPRAAAPAVVVVELFTSEGCSSCPPADLLLQRLVDSPPLDGVQIVALGEHVDYWDQQGWKDRFSSAALTNRQRVYSRAFNTDNIYTPQMVVDGRAEFVGSDAAAARRAIAQAVTAPRGIVRIAIESDVARSGAPDPVARLKPSRSNATTQPSRHVVATTPSRAMAVTVTAFDLPTPGRGDRDEIIVAVTENRLTSDVRRGENQGRVLAHAAVVRQLRAIGDATGQLVRSEIAIDPAWNPANITVVAFVQESRSRRIVAASAMPLESARR